MSTIVIKDVNLIGEIMSPEKKKKLNPSPENKDVLCFKPIFELKFKTKFDKNLTN